MSDALGMNLSGVLSAALGAAAAVAADVAVSRRAPRHRFTMQAAGLAAAAAVYPVARRERGLSAEGAGDVLALVGFAALAAVASRHDRVRGPGLLAAGWLGHGVFDLVHGRGPHSRLPEWYPAFCAGYDAGVAARLLHRRTPRP